MFVLLSGDSLLEGSIKFQEILDSEKNKANIDWYPYGILNNFSHLQEIFNEFPLGGLAGEKALNIRRADGDLAFFLSSLKFDLAVLEHPPTNLNSCKGIDHLNAVLKNKARVKKLI
jgi:hypothetical protein